MLSLSKHLPEGGFRFGQHAGENRKQQFHGCDKRNITYWCRRWIGRDDQHYNKNLLLFVSNDLQAITNACSSTNDYDIFLVNTPSVFARLRRDKSVGLIPFFTFLFMRDDLQADKPGNQCSEKKLTNNCFETGQWTCNPRNRSNVTISQCCECNITEVYICRLLRCTA